MFELKQTQNRYDHPTSYYVAAIVLSLSLILTLAIFIKMLKKPDDNNILSNAKPKKFSRELTNAVKPNFSRMYYPFFLFQRLILVATVSLYESSGGKVKTGVFIALQFLFVVFVIAARPFTRIKDNIGEIISQTFLLAIFGFTGYKMSADSWSDGETNLFIGLIITNAVIFSLISIGGFISGLITEVDAHEGPNSNVIVSQSFVKHLNLEKRLTSA